MRTIYFRFKTFKFKPWRWVRFSLSIYLLTLLSIYYMLVNSLLSNYLKPNYIWGPDWASWPRIQTWHFVVSRLSIKWLLIDHSDVFFCSLQYKSGWRDILEAESIIFLLAVLNKPSSLEGWIYRSKITKIKYGTSQVFKHIHHGLRSRIIN